MIFSDNPTQTFDHRIVDAVNYIKYCRHKARNLSPEDSSRLLQYCLANRILRMPDNNKKIIDAIRDTLDPRFNFSIKSTKVSTSQFLLEHSNEKLSDTSGPPLLEIRDLGLAPVDTAQQSSLQKIIDVFYGPSPRAPQDNRSQDNGPQDNGSQATDPEKIEKIVATLQILANRIDDTEYRLIDILPQLGEVFEAKEEVIKYVLAETINKLFDVLDVEKFNAVKLKSHLNTPDKRKAFLFDLLTQNFQRLRSQQGQGLYLNEALELYRQKSKHLGID